MEGVSGLLCERHLNILLEKLHLGPVQNGL